MVGKKDNEFAGVYFYSTLSQKVFGFGAVVLKHGFVGDSDATQNLVTGEVYEALGFILANRLPPLFLAWR